MTSTGCCVESDIGEQGKEWVYGHKVIELEKWNILEGERMIRKGEEWACRLVELLPF